MGEPVAQEPSLGEGIVGPEVAQHLRMLVSEIFDLVVNRSPARMTGGSPAAPAKPWSRELSPTDPSVPGMDGTSPSGVREAGAGKPGKTRMMVKWSPSEHLLAAEQLMVAGANRLSRVLDCEAGRIGSPLFLGPVRLASPPQVQRGMTLEVIARQMTQAAERFARIVESMTPGDSSRRFVSEGSPGTLGELVADIVARFEVHLHAVASYLARPRDPGEREASPGYETPAGGVLRALGEFMPLPTRSAAAH